MTDKKAQNKITYMTVANRYETEYLEAMAKSRDDCVHVPNFEVDLYDDYEDETKSKLLADSIEAMVAKSEVRFGKQYHLMMTPILNYLYDVYHVDPADLEFIAMMYIRNLIKSSTSGIWTPKAMIRKTIDAVIEEIGAGEIISDDQRDAIYNNLLSKSEPDEDKSED